MLTKIHPFHFRRRKRKLWQHWQHFIENSMSLGEKNRNFREWMLKLTERQTNKLLDRVVNILSLATITVWYYHLLLALLELENLWFLFFFFFLNRSTIRKYNISPNNQDCNKEMLTALRTQNIFPLFFLLESAFFFFFCNCSATMNNFSTLMQRLAQLMSWVVQVNVLFRFWGSIIQKRS